MKRDIRSALVVCTRRIGDVLLATPVVRSLKSAYPDAAVDMLVFDGTQDVVSANKDIRRIWTVPERPPFGTHVALLRSMWRRYDLAVSVLAGDRPTVHAWVAGRYCIGTLLTDKKSWWKRRLLDDWVPFDNLNTHTVSMNLRLLESLEIKPLGTPVVSWRPEDEASIHRVFPEMESPTIRRLTCLAEVYLQNLVGGRMGRTWTVVGRAGAYGRGGRRGIGSTSLQ